MGRRVVAVTGDLFRTPDRKRFGAGIFDPPWWEQGGGKVKRGADRHYPLMKTAAIAALPVAELFDDNAHLWLWVTNNFLEDGLLVMRAWGFHYVSNLAWVKMKNGRLQQGLGQYMKGSHELLLFGKRGRLPYKVIDGKRAQVPTVIIAERTEHSRKPDGQYDVVERVSHGPFIEGFARRERPGWDNWGNHLAVNTVEIGHDDTQRAT